MLVEFTQVKLVEYYNSLITNLDKDENSEKLYTSYLNNIPANDGILEYIHNLEKLLKAKSFGLDYSHQIKKLVSEKEQRTCWIIRLQIFISILISVINDIQNTLDAKKQKQNINLAEYKLGIFGSDKPTSDIDIGIQYTATGESNLAELVQIIEDKFISLGYRTLDFDIEFYGDLLTITKLVDALPVEYLYLSNSEFDCGEFLELLPYCGASIYRNYLHRLGGNRPAELARENFTEEFRIYCETYITKLINTAKLVLFDDTKNLLFSLLRACVSNSGFSKLFYDVEKYMYSTDELDDKLEIFNYQRNEYYKRITAVEDVINNKQSLITSNTYKLSTDEILSIITGIGNALIYREESYVCVPTIIHIVRIMQAKSANARAKMGSYGYLVSILEQFGYLFRFEGNDVKFDKYNTRLIDALNNIKISSKLEKCITNLDISSTVSEKLSSRPTLKRSRPSNTNINNIIGGRKFSQRRSSQRKNIQKRSSPNI